jgi:hypothetical protein
MSGQKRITSPKAVNESQPDVYDDSVYVQELNNECERVLIRDSVALESYNHAKRRNLLENLCLKAALVAVSNSKQVVMTRLEEAMTRLHS